MFNIPELNEAMAAVVPDRPAIVHGDRRLTFKEVSKRTNRLAHVLLAHDVTIHRERAELENWQSGQDAVALYLYNGAEYLEGMLGAFKARAVPFNVNYRYVAEEARYVMADAGTQAVIYHACFAPVVAETLAMLPAQPKLLLQVADNSGEPLLPGALDYETALADAGPEPVDLDHSPDDLYLLYTGGTTGMPKGVLWRQGDSIVAQLAGRRGDGSLLENVDAYKRRAERSPGHRVMPTSPLMHGAGSYVAFNAWHTGNTVVIQTEVERLNAADVLATIEREKVNMFLVIGDAFGRPLVEEGRRNAYDLSSVENIFNTGAILSEQVKLGLLELMPGATIVDALGSSETGPQALIVSNAKNAGKANADRFKISGEARVVADDGRTLLKPGHDGTGWLAKTGSVPMGYLGDRERTQKTFPVIDGVRYAVSGDKVRLKQDGQLDYLGRESFTINSGGEKIFVEEVEQAVLRHPDVIDAVVSSRPSERWGNEVVAIVQMRDGAAPDRQSILDVTAERVARYKLPKAFLFVPEVARGANGKADYRWAKSIAGEST